MKKRAEPSQKNRILDAAEHAFAEQGFAGASLRQIVSRARVNLATVYYHFESKAGLMAAVIHRRFDPLRQEHLARLRQLQQEARGGPLALADVIEALLAPLAKLAGDNSPSGRAVTRLIGRVVTEPNPQFQDLLRAQHDTVRAEYVAALQRSLPGLPVADLQWRVEFFWGAVAFILSNPRKIEKMSGGVCNPADTPTVRAQMLAYFTAGFQAPSVAAG